MLTILYVWPMVIVSNFVMVCQDSLQKITRTRTHTGNGATPPPDPGNSASRPLNDPNAPPFAPPCEQTRARYSCISCSRVYYQPTFPRGSSSLLTPIRRHPISRPTRLDQGPSLIPTQTRCRWRIIARWPSPHYYQGLTRDPLSLPIPFSCSKIIFC